MTTDWVSQFACGYLSVSVWINIEYVYLNYTEQVASVQLIVTLVMGLWLQQTNEESATVTMILIVMNAMVVGCMLFTLVMTVSGVTDTYETLKASGGAIVAALFQQQKNVERVVPRVIEVKRKISNAEPEWEW